MPNLSKNKLALIIEENGPDAFYKDKPLLVWLIGRPELLEAILDIGANPNIEFDVKNGLTITTMAACRLILRKMSQFLNSLGPFQDILASSPLKKYIGNISESMNILKRYGGKSCVYRHYIRLDIH